MSKNEKEKEAVTAMKVLKVIGITILGIGAAFLFGLVIMWLWNWLMPTIFALPEITYWQGIGLLILSSILFGRLGSSSSSDKKKEKKSKDSVEEQIEEEIKKEFMKEFENECRKKADAGENAGYEKAYDEWWEAEGKLSFEKYAKRNEEK